MLKGLRRLLVAAAALAFCGLALAEPEVKSPCTFDLPAEWLVPLKSLSAKSVKTKVARPVDCEGAVVTAVSATGKESLTTLDFSVAYKPGRDRAAFISFAVIDENNRGVGVGETRGTLAAGATSHLNGSFTMKSRDFDRVFESGKTPILRITVRMGRE